MNKAITILLISIFLHGKKITPPYTSPGLAQIHFEVLLNLNPSVEGLVLIQDINPRIHKWNIKIILSFCMNNMAYVSSTIWRIKNQPYNSTSCSDNALHFWVLVTR